MCRCCRPTARHTRVRQDMRSGRRQDRLPADQVAEAAASAAAKAAAEAAGLLAGDPAGLVTGSPAGLLSGSPADESGEAAGDSDRQDLPGMLGLPGDLDVLEDLGVVEERERPPGRLVAEADEARRPGATDNPGLADSIVRAYAGEDGITPGEGAAARAALQLAVGVQAAAGRVTQLNGLGATLDAMGASAAGMASAESAAQRAARTYDDAHRRYGARHAAAMS